MSTAQVCSNSSLGAVQVSMHAGLRPMSCSMHQTAASMHQHQRVAAHSAAAPAQTLGRLQRAYPAARPDALELQRTLSRHRSACLGGAGVQLLPQQQQARQTPERLRCAAATTEAPAAAPKGKGKGGKKGRKGGGGSGSSGGNSAAGASTISSGIKLENVSITFKNQQVLRGVTWEVKKGERVGLVGVNGAGKTTQLQIITGQLQPDGGEVIKARANMKIAHLTQEFNVVPTRTVREEFLSAFGEQVELLTRQEALQKGLETVGEDMEAMTRILDELDSLNSKAVDLDVDKLDLNIDRMMPELGFSPEDNDRLVASYSGGWQMRMCLGKILLQQPDLLLLDEPTNHLDLEAIEWLEGYLKQQEIPMVIVSHDREFLDQLCTKIVHTEFGLAHTFAGNYTRFTNAREEAVAQQWAAWEKQQKEIARQEEMVSRLSAGAASGRAATAEKTLEKLNAEGVKVKKPFVPKKRTFQFPAVERMGQVAVNIENLTHGYQDRQLFDSTSLQVERGERVALIGPNGAGKSTLLRLIMGREQPISGRVELGAHGIVPNYFEQNQAEALDPELSATETLERAAPDAELQDIKALLGRMLFSGRAAHKKVSVLSGGEKARLALAKFMLTRGSLLVLDEPTNHLDIPSKETLEEALRSFQGSVIAVSHDRYFLKQIATRIVAVEDAKLRDYEGNYEEFLEKNEEEAEVMAAKEEKIREIEKDNIKAKSKMSKAEKLRIKKQKAKAFTDNKNAGKVAKNAKRWN